MSLNKTVISTIAFLSFLSMRAMDHPALYTTIIPAHAGQAPNGQFQEEECAIDACPHQGGAALQAICRHRYHLLCIQKLINNDPEFIPYRKYSAKLHEKAPNCPICVAPLNFNERDLTGLNRELTQEEQAALNDIILHVHLVKEREEIAKHQPPAKPRDEHRPAAAAPQPMNYDQNLSQGNLDQARAEKATFLESLQRYGGDTAIAGLFLGFLTSGEIQQKPTRPEGAQALKRRRIAYAPTAAILYTLLHKMTPHAQWDYARTSGHVLGILTGMAIPYWLMAKKPSESLRTKKEHHQTDPTTGSTSYKGDHEGQEQ